MSARTSKVRSSPHFAALVVLLALLVGARISRAQEEATEEEGAASAPTTPTLQPPADLAHFVGLPITRVDVVLDDDTWSDVALPTVRIVRPGQKLSPLLARQALQEALGTGRFASGRVAVAADGTGAATGGAPNPAGSTGGAPNPAGSTGGTPNPAGVRLVLHLVPRKLIETLRIDLHGGRVEVSELRREADLAENGEIIGAQLPALRKRIADLFAQHGYPSANVSLTTRPTDDPTRVIVLLDVNPGAERLIHRRAFYVFDANEQEIADLEAGYAVPEGTRADKTALDAADTDLEGRLAKRGYHRARVTHDVVVASGHVFLRVRIDAGPRFSPRFEGNDHFDTDALSGALDLEDETDRTPGHLTQKIADFYVKHGYLDVGVVLETRGDRPGSKVVFLVFHIVERRRVNVVSRAYPCLKEADIKGLDDAPTSASSIGNEIDSYLDDELPGADLVKDPDPAGLDELLEGHARVPRGSPPVPIDLDPDAVYAPDTYDRAVLHVQELYRNEGFLHAVVGPVQVVRRHCAPRSPAGRCIPIPLPHPPVDACTYDATGVPLPTQALDPALTCTPDPAHGVECDTHVQLRIPMKLGPRTMLYDLSFSGARSIPEKSLAAAAALTLGGPANALKLDEARRHILDAYREEGFAYADVKYSLDSSLDHTRARARFDIVEGDRVIVHQIVIRGNERTNESLIRRRIALEEGKPYRTSNVRKTEERIATLNVFSSVNVALEDPYVPQSSKTVIITVVERLPQSVEVRPGLSTGEGFRFAFEYAHRNLFGEAIGLTLQIQLSYLPDFLILDDQVRQNYDTQFGSPGLAKRLATRSTVSLSFPEVGLGPLVRATIDGVLVRDLERDYALLKEAGLVNLYYRPVRQLQFAITPDVEHNDVTLFAFNRVGEYLQSIAQQQGGLNTDLARKLRVPTGSSYAVAQRFTVSWDRRDNTFNAHRGTYIVSGIEHVDWTTPTPACNSLTGIYAQAVGGPAPPQGIKQFPPGPNDCDPSEGHFLRFTETVAAYVPVTKSITLAGQIRFGTNVQLGPNSTTYPDRLFFLGGIDSMRGYLLEQFVPQDYADLIAANYGKPDTDPTKFTINQVALRGGNLMVNPRLELRIPVKSPFETVLFVDSGNLWVDPTYFIPTAIGGKGGAFSLRTSAGTGIRLQTPIGPLALDYGINMSRLVSSPTDPRRSYEDFGALNFAIGLF